MRRLQLQIRLNERAYSKYMVLAEAKNQSLSTYLRDKLESDIDLQSSLQSVESKLLAIQYTLTHETINPFEERQKEQVRDLQETVAPDPLLMEIVLLLRGIVRADHMNMVHGELRRQGLDVFSFVS